MHALSEVVPRSRAPRRFRGSDRGIHPIGAYAPEARNTARRAYRGAAFLLAALLALLSAGCTRTPPEQALRDTIAAMEAAAEARDADALEEYLAEDFVGPGGMDRDGFRRTAALLWLRSREIGVSLGPLEVEVTGEHARVRFTAATRGGEGLLPDSANVHAVDTAWRIEDGEWRLISAEWAPTL